MKPKDDATSEINTDLDFDDGGDDTPLELERPRSSSALYSAQARQRIEYLQELRRLRSLVGDDGLDDF